MIRMDTLWITDIPENTRDLVVQLNSQVDIDLKLYDSSGVCIAGYDCINDEEGTFEWNGMNIYFSGDLREPPVIESIEIDWVQETLTLDVMAYETGDFLFSESMSHTSLASEKH